MHRPDISVVIPTYDRREYLQQAIASCFDGNDGLDVEVVVMDDGSSDGPLVP
jgi:glycosyltransferase involved in cell wall biosynthesis